MPASSLRPAHDYQNNGCRGHECISILPQVLFLPLQCPAHFRSLRLSFELQLFEIEQPVMKHLSTWYKADRILENTYVGAEVFQGKSLHGIDAELRAWLHNGEPSRHCEDHTLLVHFSQPRKSFYPFGTKASLLPSTSIEVTPRSLTEKLLASTAFFDYFNKSGLQLLN